MLYGLELWPVVQPATAMDAVLLAAAKMAAGVRASTLSPSWVKNRSISNDVLLTDLDLLGSADQGRVAHARQLARDRASDAAAASLRGHDPLSVLFFAGLPAGLSPDYMGAAVRASMPTRDAWLRRATAAYDLASNHQAPALGGLPVRPRASDRRSGAIGHAGALGNGDLRAGITLWAHKQRGVGVAGAGATAGPLRGRLRKRARPRLAARNPLARGLCLPGTGVAPYTRSPSDVVYPLMALRSSHLPGDYAVTYGTLRRPHACFLCQCDVYDEHRDLLGDDPREHRWLHIEHLLLSCPCLSAAAGLTGLASLRVDLLHAVAGDAVARAVVCDAFPSAPDSDLAAAVCPVPFLLDPSAALPASVSRAARALCTRLVAAFVAGVAARVSAVCAYEPVAVGAVWVPPGTRLRAWLFGDGSCARSGVSVPAAVGHVVRSSAPARRGAVADARLGVA